MILCYAITQLIWTITQLIWTITLLIWTIYLGFQKYPKFTSFSMISIRCAQKLDSKRS